MFVNMLANFRSGSKVENLEEVSIQSFIVFFFFFCSILWRQGILIHREAYFEDIIEKKKKKGKSFSDLPL